MVKLNQKEVQQYVEKNIGIFHQKRIESLEKKLKLNDVLKRKNPYLFKAKNIQTAHDLIKSLLDAHISSNEETIFGDWLEGLAIFVNNKIYGGYKSGMAGIDLEFDNKKIRYIITIKSGPNWGNSSQIAKMKSDFNTAIKRIRTSNSKINVVAINGCCYGKDNKPIKDGYYKYCGQKFWEFISGDENLYLDIIEPLGYKAKEKNEQFLELYSKTLNMFTLDFAKEFCTKNGSINWDKLVQFNSKSKEK